MTEQTRVEKIAGVSVEDPSCLPSTLECCLVLGSQTSEGWGAAPIGQDQSLEQPLLGSQTYIPSPQLASPLDPKSSIKVVIGTTEITAILF